MTQQVLLRDWLAELRTTTLPQHRGGGGNLCSPCALTVALTMVPQTSDLWDMPTDSAMKVLGGYVPAHERLYQALEATYVRNDNEEDGLTFIEIADWFEATYPDLLAEQDAGGLRL